MPLRPGDTSFLPQLERVRAAGVSGTLPRDWGGVTQDGLQRRDVQGIMGQNNLRAASEVWQ
jgi:hypothetical protein